MDAKKLKILIPLIVVLLIIVIIVGTIIASYNSTVQMRENIDSDYAQVINRIQQRHDKMEQIISAVEGLQEHATDIYKMITDARTAYSEAKDIDGYIEADSMDAKALNNLLVVVESNPSITATSAYYAYIDEASAMENALAIARKDYNDSVRIYNTEVKKFPKVLYIGMFGFEKEMEYWQLADGAGEIPLVNYDK